MSSLILLLKSVRFLPSAGHRRALPVSHEGCRDELVETESREEGFTLLELIIVIAIVGILAAVAMPMMQNLPRKANESVLKQNLHTMRSMLDQHYADKGYYPSSLETLVEEGYLRSIPIDPFTQTSDTWIEIIEEIPDDLGAETEYSEDGPGIWDVASGSELLSLDGESYYSDW